MEKQLEGKVAVVTDSASGIGLASTEAMIAQGARVVFIDRNEIALVKICEKHGDAPIPLIVDLIDEKQCNSIMPRILDITS